VTLQEPARTLIEAAFVAAVTLGLGLGANALHPDRLSLGRDYFRVEAPPRAGAQSAPAAAVAPAAPATPEFAAEFTDPIEAQVAARLAARGLAAITHAQAVEDYHDPMYAAGGTVFIDARKDSDYLAGHIPGAWQFDHYHLGRYVDEVLPVCLSALKIVVYCHGRDCADSELAALDLISFGVDPARVSVYVGGWTSWTADDQPVERGPRGSSSGDG